MHVLHGSYVHTLEQYAVTALDAGSVLECDDYIHAALEDRIAEEVVKAPEENSHRQYGQRPERRHIPLTLVRHMLLTPPRRRCGCDVRNAAPQDLCSAEFPQASRLRA